MQPPLKNFILRVGDLAKRELALREEIAESDTLFNGSPNWDDLITQTDIDNDPQLSAAGLTKQMIADVIYSANNANQAVSGNLAAFVVMANL